jgi:ubiquinol-cytochrome c reductase cytochrome b subunit
MPGFDVTIGHYTVVPNPFWGGAAFPLLVFLVLFAWPALERRATGDYGFHNLLDRPRDAPWRTAIGVAFFTWIFIVFVAGAADRLFVLFDLSYQGQIWAYRVLVWVLPVVALFVTQLICKELVRGERVERRRKLAEAEPVV